MKNLIYIVIGLCLAVAGYFIVNLNWAALFNDSPIILDEVEARELLTTALAGEIVSLEFKNSKTPYYVAEIQTDDQNIIAEVDAISKRISIKNSEKEMVDEGSANAPTLPLTKESAVALAVAEFEKEDGVKATSVVLVNKNGEEFYEVKVVTDLSEATVLLNVATGEIESKDVAEINVSDNIQSVASGLKNSRKEESSTNDSNIESVEKPQISEAEKAVLLTEEQAKNVALSKVAGEVRTAKKVSEHEFYFEIVKDAQVYIVEINSENSIQVKTSTK